VVSRTQGVRQGDEFLSRRDSSLPERHMKVVKIRLEKWAAESPVCDLGTGSSFRGGGVGVVFRGALPADSSLAKPRALNEAQSVVQGEGQRLLTF
jgi:hypothetical protein